MTHKELNNHITTVMSDIQTEELPDTVKDYTIYPIQDIQCRHIQTMLEIHLNTQYCYVNDTLDDWLHKLKADYFTIMSFNNILKLRYYYNTIDKE